MKKITTLVTTLALTALLSNSGPAFSQQGQTCIGRTCGRDMGYPIEHCHIRPGADLATTNDVCWSSLPDFVCENMGYDLNVTCPESAVFDLGGGVASQTLGSVGGFNVFRNEIQQTATARVQEDDSGEEGEAAASGVHASEISTNLEHESWDLGGSDGDTTGIAFGWQRETEVGHRWGVTGSYQTAEADSGGDSLDVINLNVNYGRKLKGIWNWSVFGSGSDISGLFDETLFGAGGQVYFNKYFDGGSVLSGGVLAQFQAADVGDDVKTVGYGIAYGFPIGQRFTLDFDVYGVSLVDVDVENDNFFTLGAMFGIYLTPRFTLTVGYRILEGIDDLDSSTITVGSSTRW